MAVPGMIVGVESQIVGSTGVAEKTGATAVLVASATHTTHVLTIDTMLGRQGLLIASHLRIPSPRKVILHSLG